jgi:alanine dehydrogenase
MMNVVAKMLSTADLVIGGVLVTGRRTPRLVSRDMVAAMEPGSAIVDVSMDQGGCVATTHPTTYADPTYQELGVTHFAVTNMPGAVPRAASHALSAAILPYVQQIAEPDWQAHPPLARGVNVSAGELVHQALR